MLPGNHESAAQVAEPCAALRPRTRSTAAPCRLGGYHVAGLGYSNPTPFHTPGEYSEPEMERRLQPFAGA